MIDDFRDRRRWAEKLNKMRLEDTKSLLFYMRLEKQVRSASLPRSNEFKNINVGGLWKMVSPGLGQASTQKEEKGVQGRPRDYKGLCQL